MGGMKVEIFRILTLNLFGCGCLLVGGRVALLSDDWPAKFKVLNCATVTYSEHSWPHLS